MSKSFSKIVIDPNKDYKYNKLNLSTLVLFITRVGVKIIQKLWKILNVQCSYKFANKYLVEYRTYIEVIRKFHIYSLKKCGKFI